MKKILFLIFQIIGTSTILGQDNPKTNPENILLKYNKDGASKIIYKNELSHNLDSINMYVLNEIKHELFIKMDSLQITKLLVGKWSLQNAYRINDKEEKYQTHVLELKGDGTFIDTYPSDTTNGKWSYQKTEIGNLKLDYNEPQSMIKDKNLLKNLDEKTIKSMTYSSRTMAINSIDDESLRFFDTILIDSSLNSGEIYYRVIFINHKKEK